MNLTRDELLLAVQLEPETRELRSRKVEVLNLVPTKGSLGERRANSTALVPAGSVAAFIAPAGAKILKEIRAAVAKADGRDLDLAARLEAEYSARPQMPLEKAVALMQQQEVIASVEYGGQRLITGAFCPEGLSVFAIPFPYNGARLASSGFRLLEHYKPKSRAKLDMVIVKREPPLSKAERAALAKLPASMGTTSVAPGLVGFAPGLVLIALGVCLVTGLCCPHTKHQPDIQSDQGFNFLPNIPDAELRRMSASMAAVRLLAIRRKILEHRV